jgi:hypothetical protein
MIGCCGTQQNETQHKGSNGDNQQHKRHTTNDTLLQSVIFFKWKVECCRFGCRYTESKCCGSVLNGYFRWAMHAHSKEEIL